MHVDFSTILLGKDMSSFPAALHLGDIVYCINVQIKYFNDMKQLIANLNKNSGIITVHRKLDPITGEESAYRNNPRSETGLSFDEWEIQSSSSRIRNVEWVTPNKVNEVYEWVRAQFRSSKLHCSATEESTLGSISHIRRSYLEQHQASNSASSAIKKTHDIVCCLVHKELHELGVWRLYVWDGTLLANDIDPGQIMTTAELNAVIDTIRQSLLSSFAFVNREDKVIPEPLTLLGGIAAADYCVTSDVRTIDKICTGTWIRLRNVHVNDSLELTAPLLEILKDSFLAIVPPTFK